MKFWCVRVCAGVGAMEGLSVMVGIGIQWLWEFWGWG